MGRTRKIARICPGCRQEIWVLPLVRLGYWAMFDPEPMATEHAFRVGFAWQRGTGMVDVSLLADRLVPARCHLRHACRNQHVGQWMAEQHGDVPRYSVVGDIPLALAVELDALFSGLGSPTLERPRELDEPK